MKYKRSSILVFVVVLFSALTLGACGEQPSSRSYPSNTTYYSQPVSKQPVGKAGNTSSYSGSTTKQSSQPASQTNQSNSDRAKQLNSDLNKWRNDSRDAWNISNGGQITISVSDDN